MPLTRFPCRFSPEEGVLENSPVGRAHITSSFGAVGDVSQHTEAHPHNGLDLVPADTEADGAPIYALMPGTVFWAGTAWNGDNYVVVTFDGGVTGGYFHMKYPSPLGNGTRVDADTILGYVGATGNATGPHLHWMLAPTAANPLAQGDKLCINPLKQLVLPPFTREDMAAYLQAGGAYLDMGEHAFIRNTRVFVTLVPTPPAPGPDTVHEGG